MIVNDFATPSSSPHSAGWAEVSTLKKRGAGTGEELSRLLIAPETLQIKY